MEQEIIIPRKKSKSIQLTIGMFFTTIIMLLPAIIYFFDFEWITSDMSLLVVIIGLLCTPVCVFCFIWYFRQIFNNNPILIINEKGIYEQMSRNFVGLIKWDDIANITIIPYMDKTYFIGISFKEPSKYIKNQSLLNKINRQRTTKKWGHINFSSLYFKKEFERVLTLMKYYFNKYNGEIDF